jgi:hypothetical protein
MLYEVIKEFQSGIVGLLGFCGVILTMAWNARLARTARQEAIQHIRVTTRLALREELKAYRKQFETVLTFLSRKEDRPLFTIAPTAEVYKALLKDLGSLDANEVEPVIGAHANLILVEEALRSLADDKNAGLLSLQPAAHPRAKIALEWAVEQIDNAIKVLE